MLPLNLFQGSFEDVEDREALSEVSSDLRLKVHQKVHQLRCLTNIRCSILIKSRTNEYAIYECFPINFLSHNFVNKFIRNY